MANSSPSGHHMQCYDWFLTSREEVETFVPSLSTLYLPGMYQRSPRDSSPLSGAGAEAFMSGHYLWVHDMEHLHKPFWFGFLWVEFSWPGFSAGS
jgi:hypothetical protein